MDHVRPCALITSALQEGHAWRCCSSCAVDLQLLVHMVVNWRVAGGLQAQSKLHKTGNVLWFLDGCRI